MRSTTKLRIFSSSGVKTIGATAAAAQSNLGAVRMDFQRGLYVDFLHHCHKKRCKGIKNSAPLQARNRFFYVELRKILSFLRIVCIFTYCQYKVSLFSHTSNQKDKIDFSSKNAVFSPLWVKKSLNLLHKRKKSSTFAPDI